VIPTQIVANFFRSLSSHPLQVFATKTVFAYQKSGFCGRLFSAAKIGFVSQKAFRCCLGYL
jgi:hypothetical protein